MVFLSNERRTISDNRQRIKADNQCEIKLQLLLPFSVTTGFKLKNL